jgi:hypothetical protein
MTPQQIQQLERHLNTWRKAHPDADSLRAEYRQRLLDFSLNSMALEREPVDRARLQTLLNQPNP